MKPANLEGFKEVDAQGTFKNVSYPPFVEFSVLVSNETPEVSAIRILGSDRKVCYFKLSHGMNKADTSYFYAQEGFNSPR